MNVDRNMVEAFLRSMQDKQYGPAETFDALLWFACGWEEGVKEALAGAVADKTETFVAGISEPRSRKWSPERRAKFAAAIRRRNGKGKGKRHG